LDIKSKYKLKTRKQYKNGTCPAQVSVAGAYRKAIRVEIKLNGNEIT
jgi:hypothetical protein